MPRPDDFQGRVNYAAAVIAKGARRSGCSRAFDSCFENHDGDEVCALLVRRSENNPRLAANLWTFLARDSVMDAVERLKDIPTREMAAHAAQTRAKAEAEFRDMMAKREAEYEATRQRGRDAGYRVELSAPYQWAIYRPDGSSLPIKLTLERDAWVYAGEDAAKITATA